MICTFAATGFSNAIPELERAVALDPNYAQACIRLSGPLFFSVEKGYIPGAKAIPRALGCAEKATKLDPSNGRAWEWVGHCNLAPDYDFARAEPLLRKAMQLGQQGPHSGSLRHNLACLLWYYGRFDEAEANFRQVIREQPSQGFSNGQLGLVHASRRRFADALNSLGAWIQLQPGMPMGYMQRGEILWALDRRDEAARDWLRYVELDGFSSLNHEDAALLNTTLQQAGPDGLLRGLIEALEQRVARGQFVSAYDLARLHAFAGNRTRSLDYLEQAVDEHRTYTLSAKVHPAFREFQDEPRYHAVLRRLKLEK